MQETNTDKLKDYNYLAKQYNKIYFVEFYLQVQNV